MDTLWYQSKSLARNAMYNRLYSSITSSTVWDQPHATRIVWITLLALMDRFGRIETTMSGLAHTARVTLSECKTAIETFLAPEECEVEDEFDGRRIERIDRGFRVLKASKYRELKDEEYKRAKNAEYQQRHRDKLKMERVNPPENLSCNIRAIVRQNKTS